MPTILQISKICKHSTLCRPFHTAASNYLVVGSALPSIFTCGRFLSSCQHAKSFWSIYVLYTLNPKYLYSIVFDSIQSIQCTIEENLKKCCKGPPLGDDSLMTQLQMTWYSKTRVSMCDRMESASRGSKSTDGLSPFCHRKCNKNESRCPFFLPGWQIWIKRFETIWICDLDYF